MFKIKQQIENGILTNKYTLICYVYDKNTHSNKEIYSISNLLEEDLARHLQGRIDMEFHDDLDFNMIVLKTGNGPVLLAANGEMAPTPVKRPVPTHKETVYDRRGITEKFTSLFQTKKGRRVSH